jgi:transposase
MGDMINMSNDELKRIKVLTRVLNREIKQAVAAQELNLSIRQVKRLVRSYKEQGDPGLLSKKRGKPSNHQLSPGVKSRALEIIYQFYRDFGATLTHEKLTEEHELKLSLSSVRNIMISNQIWEPKKLRKAVVHQMRERRAREGELVQIDGSPHDWFEGRAPKCTLLVYIDDATGKLLQLHFTEAESNSTVY